MKKIVIASQNGINPKYKKWAREATAEILSLFPEYKNSFTIEFRDDTNSPHKEISQTEYDNLPDDNHKLQFVKTARGTWLVPYESMEWFVEQATKPNRRNGSDAVDVSILAGLQKARIEQKAKDEIVVSLLNGRFSPACFGYTLGDAINAASVAISLDNCQDEEFFKTILMHEFGHVFNATHQQRSNVHYDPALGPHCTNDDCIMGERDYHRLSQERLDRKNQNRPPFCNECIEEMRRYMERMPELSRELNVENRNTPSLPELPHNDDSWKNDFRVFYQNIANRDGFVYEEDEQTHNYLANIKRTDGSALNIEANNEYNIALGATDADGKSDYPKISDFEDVIALARKKKAGINFGKDNDNEYNARLLIACLEATPKISISNKPIVNEEFLASLQPATKARLLTAMQRQQQNQNNPSPSPSPTPTPSPAPAPQPVPSDPFEAAMAARTTELSRLATLGSITPQETAELNMLKLYKQHDEELKKAEKRTGSQDPRFAEHQQKSGLSVENYYYSSPSRKSDAAWKLHLDVVPNRNHPATKDVSEFLEQLEVEHKIAHGGENGKGMTIYVGGYEDAKRLSREINMRFGRKISRPPVYTDQANSEIMFNPVTSGRFYLQSIFETQYPHTFVRGITPSTVARPVQDDTEAVIFAFAQKEGVFDATKQLKDVDAFRNPNIHDQFVFSNLEAYCAHKLYSKHLGRYYDGNRPEELEQKLFNGALPDIGSPERAKWDKVADAHIRKIENDHPDKIRKMKTLKRNYTRIDFSKVPPLPQRQNNNGHGRS